jgi:hypothetical protein
VVLAGEWILPWFACTALLAIEAFLSSYARSLPALCEGRTVAARTF